MNTTHNTEDSGDDIDKRQRKLENWGKHYEEVDPHELDTSNKLHPDDIPTSQYEYDDDGAYNPAAGVTDRDAALEAGRCGTKLTNAEQRYGEPRYCTRLPIATFTKGGDQVCYEHRDSK